MELTGRPSSRARKRSKIRLVVAAGQQLMGSVLVAGMTAVMVTTNGLGVLSPNPHFDTVTGFNNDGKPEFSAANYIGAMSLSVWATAAALEHQPSNTM